MDTLVLRLTFRRWGRLVLWGLGLLLVTAGVILTATLSRSAVVVVEEDLSRSWRTSYDILVRPTGSRNPIEEAYGLVEANFTSGLRGGISLEQVQAIREIPEVEVAAPIAGLGYISTILDPTYQTMPAQGVYLLERSLVVDKGHEVWEDTFGIYVYSGPVPPDVLHAQDRPEGLVYAEGASYRNSHPSVYLLLAAIDPEQEALLLNLDQTLRQGEYLSGEERLGIRHEDTSNWPPEMRVTNPLTTVTNVPVLINATPYVHFTSTIRMTQIILPAEAQDLKDILDRGGAPYLDTLTERTLLQEHSVDSQTAYAHMVEQLLSPSSASAVHLHTLDEARRPGPRTYREIAPPFPHSAPVLELVLPEPWEGNWNTPTSLQFALEPKGVFAVDSIPRPANISQVPLETYFPPESTMRYDEAGQRVAPTLVRPTLEPDGYMLSPPLLLTTIEAARILDGDACVGAVRVRVRGIDPLTPEAQQKLSAVAAEIFRRTGLEVDIMVGSSPAHVLVHVPGLGYVEEPWVRKGVAFAYRQRVHSGHLLLLASLFVIGGVFALDLAWAHFLAHRQTVALQKALGWRSSTVLRQMLLLSLLVGLAGAALGALAARALIALLRWDLPDPALFWTAPSVAVAMSLLGNLYPAWAAARLPPDWLLRGRETPWTHRLPIRVQGLLRYATHSLVRRRTRTLLSLLAAALSTALLVLLLGVLVDRHSYLSGTVLGEYIMVQVEAYHYALLAVGFTLAAFAFAEHLLADVLERQREIGVLKALGWQTPTIGKLFLLEGVGLGLLGGVAGSGLGLMAFLALYQNLSLKLLGIALLGAGLSGLLGVIAAAYPARLAATVSPAEAMRGE